jgi:hypothetical protein
MHRHACISSRGNGTSAISVSRTGTAESYDSERAGADSGVAGADDRPRLNAHRRPAGQRVTVPAPTAAHPDRVEAHRLGEGAAIRRRELMARRPVCAVLEDVAVQVVEAERIRGVSAHRRKAAPSVVHLLRVGSRPQVNELVEF